MITEQQSVEAGKAAEDRLTEANAKVSGPQDEKANDPSGVVQDLNGEICAPCTHGREHGWWGHGTLPDDTWTHCRHCHVSFPGTQRWGHCVADGCHETFSGVTTFDAHKGYKRCPLHGAETFTNEQETKTFVRKWHEKGQFHYYGGEDYDGPQRESK